MVGLATGLAVLAGVRMYRPPRPAMWYCIAASQFATLLGDATYEYYEYVRHEEPYPSFADVFYLSSYPLALIV